MVYAALTEESYSSVEHAKKSRAVVRGRKDVDIYSVIFPVTGKYGIHVEIGDNQDYFFAKGLTEKESEAEMERIGKLLDDGCGIELSGGKAYLVNPNEFHINPERMRKYIERLRKGKNSKKAGPEPILQTEDFLDFMIKDLKKHFPEVRGRRFKDKQISLERFMGLVDKILSLYNPPNSACTTDYDDGQLDAQADLSEYLRKNFPEVEDIFKSDENKKSKRKNRK